MHRLTCAFVVRICHKDRFSNDVSQTGNMHTCGVVSSSVKKTASWSLASKYESAERHKLAMWPLPVEDNFKSQLTLTLYRWIWSAKHLRVLLYDGSSKTMRLYVLGRTFEPGHVKKGLMSYPNNKGADQPAHPRSLISALWFLLLR